MTHRTLHLIDDEGGVAEHRQFDVLAHRSEVLDENVLESAVTDGCAYIFELRACEGLFHEEVVRICPCCMVVVFSPLHYCPDDFVSQLVVLCNQLLSGVLPISVSLFSSCLTTSSTASLRAYQLYAIAQGSWFQYVPASGSKLIFYFTRFISATTLSSVPLYVRYNVVRRIIAQYPPQAQP